MNQPANYSRATTTHSSLKNAFSHTGSKSRSAAATSLSDVSHSGSQAHVQSIAINRSPGLLLGIGTQFDGRCGYQQREYLSNSDLLLPPRGSSQSLRSPKVNKPKIRQEPIKHEGKRSNINTTVNEHSLLNDIEHC